MPSQASAAKKLSTQSGAEGQDLEDWQFDPLQFMQLNMEFGPLDIDCCANANNKLLP